MNETPETNKPNKNAFFLSLILSFCVILGGVMGGISFFMQKDQINKLTQQLERMENAQSQPAGQSSSQKPKETTVIPINLPGVTVSLWGLFRPAEVNCQGYDEYCFEPEFGSFYFTKVAGVIQYLAKELESCQKEKKR